MFYCQYLAGMGHLVRSTEIVRSLMKDFDVYFINGGQLVPGFELPNVVEVINLPALRMENEELKVVDGFKDIDEVKEERKNQLIAACDRIQPDCLITECFPFSKQKLVYELVPLLDHAKASEHSPKIICSLRDIIMTQNMKMKARLKKEEKVCKLINKYYDLVLFHSDSKVQQLEECFPRVNDLNCEVYYTGYVAQSPQENPTPTAEDIANLNRGEPMIVASVGGGRYGYELLNAIVEASSILENSLPHKIHAFAGPFMPDDEFLLLQKSVATKSNVILRRYTSQLLAYLNRAELSISLAGYNTTMNILRTGVRSLIFPAPSEYQSGEQSIRAQKLEKLGVVDIIRPDDLTPENLAQKVIACLTKKPALHSFDLQGAQKASSRLKELLYSKVMVA